MISRRTLLAFAGVACLAPDAARADGPTSLLNVSYDISRELFATINPEFIARWQATGGQAIEINMSHGGSSRQARAVIEGLAADVVTLNQVPDIELLVANGLVAANWQERLPNKASPYVSFPAFVVRQGNPKHIADWSDLERADVQIVLPNPKTSGNARYTYLAAMAFGLERNNGDQAKAEAFVQRLLANVAVFDTGGRGATTTFVERGIGDVLITFEAEIQGIRRQYGDQGFETVLPSMSAKAEFPVTVVDKVVDARGTRALATAYLDYLFQPAGQEVLAQNGYRIIDPAVAQKYAAAFPAIRLIDVESVFGDWATIMRDQFGSDGVVDRLMAGR